MNIEDDDLFLTTEPVPKRRSTSRAEPRNKPIQQVEDERTRTRGPLERGKSARDGRIRFLPPKKRDERAGERALQRRTCCRSRRCRHYAVIVGCIWGCALEREHGQTYGAQRTRNFIGRRRCVDGSGERA